MKKLLKLVILPAIIILLVTGCVSNKKALTADGVKQIVEKKGYNYKDIKDEYAQYDHIKSALIFGDNNFDLKYFEINNEENAKKLFKNNKEIFDGYRKEGYTNSSTSGDNYETYELISDGDYMYLSRVGTTMLYVDVKEVYKNEVIDLIKALGY